MKRLLIVPVLGLLLAGAARADHIGIYADQTGASCNLAPGFSTTATVMHKFSLGTTGSLFSIDMSGAPGSVLFSFNSPFLPEICVNPPCGPFQYGGCLQGSFAVGTLAAVLNPGYIEVVAAEGSAGFVTTYNCAQVARWARGGRAYIGAGDCSPLATETSTWGKVKAMYR